MPTVAWPAVAYKGFVVAEMVVHSAAVMVAVAAVERIVEVQVEVVVVFG